MTVTTPTSDYADKYFDLRVYYDDELGGEVIIDNEYVDFQLHMVECLSEYLEWEPSVDLHFIMTSPFWEAITSYPTITNSDCEDAPIVYSISHIDPYGHE